MALYSYIWNTCAFFLDMDNQKFVPISCCVYDTNMGAYLNQFNCQSFKFGPPRYMDPTAARNDALHYKVRPATQKGYMVIIKKKKKIS